MPRDDILRSIEMRLRALGEISKYGTTAGAARGWETREGAAPVQYVPVPRRQAAPPPEALNVPRRRPVVPQSSSGTAPPAVREQLRQALADVAARVAGKPQAEAPSQAPAPAPAAAPTKPVLDPQKFREAVMALAARTAQKKPQAAQQAPVQAPAPAPAPVRAPAPAPAPARAPAPQPAPAPSKPAVSLPPKQKKQLEDALARVRDLTTQRQAAGKWAPAIDPTLSEATPEMQRRAAQMQAAGHGGELSLEDVIVNLLGRKKEELKALFERTGNFDSIWDGIVAAFREEVAKASPIEQADRRQGQAHGMAEVRPPSPPRPPKIPLPKQMRVNPRKLETPNVRTEKPPRLNTGVPNEK